MSTREELLVIAKLQNQMSRPIAEIKGEIHGLVDTLTRAEKVTKAEERQLRGLGTEMQRAQRDAAKLAKASHDLNEKWSRMSRTMSQYVSLPVAAAMGYAVKAASDLNEQVSKTGAVFGAAGASVTSYVNDASRNLLLSKRAAQDAASTFGALLIPMGAGQRQAADMSIALTSLAQDLSSFYDADPATALRAINSGLVGEPEPLRRFGVQLSENRVQAWAYSHGIAAANSQLTDLQKTTARYEIILNDTTLAQGDAQRTLGSAANQVRVAQKAIDDAAVSIGQDLLPLLATGAHFVAELADAFGSLPGPAQDALLALAGIVAFAGPIGTVVTVLRKLKEEMIALRAVEAVGGGAAVAEGAGGLGLSGLLAGAGPVAAAAAPVLAAIAAGVGTGALINSHASGQARRIIDSYGTLDTSSYRAVAERRNALVAQYNRLSQVAEGNAGVGGFIRNAGQVLNPFQPNVLRDAEQSTHGLAEEINNLDDTLDGLRRTGDDTTSMWGPFGAAVADTAVDLDKLTEAATRSGQAWDALFSRTLDARAAGRAMQDAVAAAAADLYDGSTATERAAMGDTIFRAIHANALAEQAHGDIGPTTADLYKRELELLTNASQSLPELLPDLQPWVDDLRDGIIVINDHLSDLRTNMEALATIMAIIDITSRDWSVGGGKSIADGSLGFSRPADSYPLPIGDATHPLSRDLATDARFGGSTLAAWQALDATVPGVRSVSSHIRGWGLGSPDSDHTTGRAVDIQGQNLPGLVAAVRRAGGAAELHGAGTGRHAHVVPALGGGAGSTTVALPPGLVNVYGQIDASQIRGIRREVRDGIKDALRDARERSG